MNDLIKSIAPFLSDDEADEMSKIATSKHFKKKKRIVSAGDVSQNVFLLKDAMVRGYIITPEGEERTIILRPPNTFIGSPEGIFHGKPSRYNFQPLDDSEVIFLPFNKVRELSAIHPGIGQMIIEVFSETIQTLLWRVESLVYKLPETRYEELIEEKPQFFQMAYHKHIANFLGVSATSLSRIIKRKVGKS